MRCGEARDASEAERGSGREAERESGGGGTGREGTAWNYEVLWTWRKEMKGMEEGRVSEVEGETRREERDCIRDDGRTGVLETKTREPRGEEPEQRE